MNDEVTRGGGVDGFSRTLEASMASHRDRDGSRIGLAVITPLHAGGRTDDVAFPETRHQDLRVASLRSIVWLAEMVSSGAFKHEEVVKLLTAALTVDVVVDLLQRSGGSRVADAPVQAPRTPAPASPEPAFWLAQIVQDGVTPADEFVQAVVVKRRIIGVVDAANQPAGPRPGDSICLFVREKGVVGRAQVVSVFEGGVELIRGSDRFNRMIRLRNIEVFDAPLPPAAALDVPDSQGAERLGPVLVPLSRQQFVELTTPGNQRKTGPVGLVGRPI